MPELAAPAEHVIVLVTLKSEPNGAEPDASYYVRNGARIAGNKKIDLTRDPVPDIVVEIDIARERIDKRKFDRFRERRGMRGQSDILREWRERLQANRPPLEA